MAVFPTGFSFFICYTCIAMYKEILLKPENQGKWSRGLDKLKVQLNLGLEDIVYQPC